MERAGTSAAKQLVMRGNHLPVFQASVSQPVLPTTRFLISHFPGLPHRQWLSPSLTEAFLSSEHPIVPNSLLHPVPRSESVKHTQHYLERHGPSHSDHNRLLPVIQNHYEGQLIHLEDKKPARGCTHRQTEQHQLQRNLVFSGANDRLGHPCSG